MKHCFKITVVFGFLLTALVSCTSSSQKPILGYGTVVPFEFDYNYYTYGKVKTIKSKYYEVQEKFGELILSDVYEASVENYNEDGIFTKIVYYDEYGDLDERYETTIEKDKIIIQDTKNKKGAKRILFINDKGIITSEKYTEPEYGIDEVYIFKYENGNLVSYKGEPGIRNHTYTYSENGTIVNRHIVINGEDILGTKYKIEKDKKGNIISIAEQDEKYPEKIDYSDFDNKGNWTKATIYRDEEARKMIIREIEYY